MRLLPVNAYIYAYMLPEYHYGPAGYLLYCKFRINMHIQLLLGE